MHKTQLYIRDDQYETLQNMATITGQKQSALIREGIDLYIKHLQQKQAWKENLMSLSGTLTAQEADEMKADAQQARTSWKRREISL